MEASPTLRRTIMALLGLSALISAGLAVGVVSRSCMACHVGPLHKALPWLALLLYGTLVVTTWRSKLEISAAGILLAVFVHVLLLEEIGDRGICIACALIGGGALAAGICLAVRAPPFAVQLGLAVLAASLLAPLNVPGAVERKLYRYAYEEVTFARMPEFVDLKRVISCPSRTPCIWMYEQPDCSHCATLKGQCVPEVREKYGSRVCMHYVEVVQDGEAEHIRPTTLIVPKDGSPHRLVLGVPGREMLHTLLGEVIVTRAR